MSNLSHRRRLRAIAVLLAVTGALIGASHAGATDGVLLITSNTKLSEDHAGSIELAANGVTLDCAGHRVSGSGFAGILLRGRRGVTVRNCDVSGFFHGIVVLGSSGNALSHNKAHDNAGAGIVLDQQSTTNVIAGNEARANGHNGIQISFSDRNVIVGNRAERNAGTGGIALGGAHDNLVILNTSNGNAAHGISVDGARNRLVANGARSNGDSEAFAAGIAVFPGSQDTLVVANHVVENGQGVRLEGATDSTVRGNSAERNRFWGYIVASSPGTVLEGNRASDNGSHGFALNGTSGAVLRRNVARANGHNGFDVLASTDNELVGNASAQNRVGGFSLLRSSGNRLRANTATGNGSPDNGPGFELGDSSRNELVGNSAFENGSTGFYAFGTSEHNLISGNTGCRNHFFDGGDRSTGAGNTWVGNTFCVTEGI
jgi:parallel beta-helix repeat protein